MATTADIELTLTRRSMHVVGEAAVVIDLLADQAEDSLQGLLKSVYSLLFAWVVGRINSILAHHMATPQAWPESTVFVDMLDIFGFENFVTNSFEQARILPPVPVAAHRPPVV